MCRCPHKNDNGTYCFEGVDQTSQAVEWFIEACNLIEQEAMHQPVQLHDKGAVRNIVSECAFVL